jgi:hypothetical protein
MANTIMMIVPYWYNGTWVFDDESKGLDKELFIEGIPEMIEGIVNDIPNARSGFKLIFSAIPFPNYQVELERVRMESGGYWYRLKGTEAEGWLCPSLFKYFVTAPHSIFARAEKL